MNQPPSEDSQFIEGNENYTAQGNENQVVQGNKNNFIQGDNNNITFVQPQNGQTIKKRDHIQQKFLYWVDTEVEKRLQQSLHNRVYIVLDKQEDPEQIQHPWEIDIKVGEQPSSRLPKGTPIEQVFYRRDIAGRLLILGAPGSGKTTILLKLAEQLVIRAKENPQHRIPVLLNLSSWKEDNQSIKDWMIADLKVKYGVRKDIATQWIEQGVILPLLDGLDELAAERQEKCVEKLNQFLHPETWSGSVVICSRIEEYQHYTRNLELNGSIILQPLTTEKIQDYVLKTEGEDLWNNINPDSDLMELAQTPLLLNIIVLSCAEISFERWNQFQSSEERRSYLFDAYIQRMLKRSYKRKRKLYKDKDTVFWLEWLAQQLIRENRTEFLIENMQPTWLENRWKRMIYNVIYRMIIGQIIVQSFYFSVILTIWLDIWIVMMYEGIIEPITYASESRIEMTIEYLTLSLIDGGSAGLIGGLVIGLIIKLIGENSIQKQNLIQRVIGGLIYSLFLTPTWGITGLIFGLVGGLILVPLNQIKTVETLKFSLKKTQEKLIYGLIIGLTCGLIFGCGAGLLNLGHSVIFYLQSDFAKTYVTITVEFLIKVIKIGLRNTIEGSVFGLIIGLIGGFIFGIIGGLQGSEIESKTTPNQGVWNSFKNTIIFALIVFLPGLGLVFLLGLKKIGLSPFSSIFIFLFGISIQFSIMGSGLPVIQHFSLRLILWFNHYSPWNYARFLDYSTDRLFLQKVGGGYRFIHDLLRQHFAEKYNEKTLTK